MDKHTINANGGASGLRVAIDMIREQQRTGAMGYGYIFSQLNYLGGGVFYSSTPPFAYAWYVVVPLEGEPYFHNGMDSMTHIDLPEYLKWIKSLDLW